MRRTLLPLAIFGLAAFAPAESYQCVVWGPIPSYDHFQVYGAGDNGMMTGYVRNGEFGNPHRAIYRTEIGYKILHPSGWLMSQINDSWGGTYHVGHGAPTTTDAIRALFWVGGGNAVDLHPTGYTNSFAYGVAGQLQVGYVTDDPLDCEECGISMQAHAGSWSRTAASFKRLHTLTHTNTAAWGTDGTAIVGNGRHRTDGSFNALYWKNANSMGINIRPSGSTQSSAVAVWGNQQGGFFKSPATDNYPHACIWSGTAASVVDLNPNAAYRNSEITAVRNGLQVGHGNPWFFTGKNQAIAWHGNAATWINLHARLPSQFQTWTSRAEDIDNQGNIMGTVSEPGTNKMLAVVWYRVN